MKIPNLFDQNPLVISQGRHNQDWSGKIARVAIDFSYIGDLICPFDGCIVKLHNGSNQGQQSYFSMVLPDGSRLICVHGYPVRTGVFNKGEVVGKCRWHHWHISIIVNGELDCIMSYLDRSIPTMTQPSLYGGDTNHPDCRWETYEDKQLNINSETDMFKDKLTQTIPTIGFDPTTQNMLLQSVNNEDASYLLTFAGKAPRDDLDRANQEIARLKAELEKEPKTVEIANPVNVELQNKLDSLEKENKSLTEMLLVANKPSKDVHSIDTLQPAQPLPIWKRSFFDTARSGTYALAGVLASTGVWEMVQIYLATGDFSEESFSKLAISAGVVLAGYLQEQAKNNRKEAEKKI
jgi:hypothetical protein